MFKKTFVAACLAGASFSANALTIGTTGGVSGGNPGGLSLYYADIVAGDVGSQFTMGWDYDSGLDHVSGNALFTINTVDLDATGQIVLQIDLTNTSVVAGTSNPRLMSFGFNTNPDGTVTIADASATDVDPFSDVVTSTTFAGFQTIDICAYAANNCAGGNINQGLSSDLTDSFYLTISGDFSNYSSFTLSDFAAKFQGVNSYELAGVYVPPNGGGNGGNGGGTSVPEPAPLALLGLGLVSLVLARRKK